MNVSRFCRQASCRQNHSHKYVGTVALINAEHWNMHEALWHVSGKVHLCCMKAFRHTLKLAKIEFSFVYYNPPKSEGSLDAPSYCVLS